MADRKPATTPRQAMEQDGYAVTAEGEILRGGQQIGWLFEREPALRLPPARPQLPSQASVMTPGIGGPVDCVTWAKESDGP